MKISSRIMILGLALAATTLLCVGQLPPMLGTTGPCAIPDSAEAFPGGGTSVRDTGIRAFGRSPMNMSRDRWPAFLEGKEVFDRDWLRGAKGVSPIGPLFSSTSCDGCHTKDGRGHPPLATGEQPESMVVRLARLGDARAQSPYGAQLDYRATKGAMAEGTVAVAYQLDTGYFDDGTPYQLHRPVYSFRNLTHGALDSAYRYSPRVAPANFGMGLLEAVAERDILVHADPDDRNHDGISGRPNVVTDLATGAQRIGRFGWKAAQPTIEQQLRTALLNDMGITSQPINDSVAAPGSARPEITAAELRSLLYYVTLVAVPNRRAFDDRQALRGQATFTEIGCAACHTPAMRTGTLGEYPEVSGQRIFPYTDLLLHDMGDALADGFTEGLATGNEWRTPPLWGIGLVPTVSGHSRFLHDGRAWSIEEAVLWHGGEAAHAQQRYRALSPADRAAVLAFLRSI